MECFECPNPTTQEPSNNECVCKNGFQKDPTLVYQFGFKDSKQCIQC